MLGFSPARFVAVLVKEFIQMRRDRVTFAMMIGVPIMQLMIFGYAINADLRRSAGRRPPFARHCPEHARLDLLRF
jgi:hypothetical protein